MLMPLPMELHESLGGVAVFSAGSCRQGSQCADKVVMACD